MLSGPETEKWGPLQHQGKRTQISISGREVFVRRILYHLSLQESHRVTSKMPLHLADIPTAFGVPSHIPWPHRPAGFNAFISLECSNIGVVFFLS